MGRRQSLALCPRRTEPSQAPPQVTDHHNLFTAMMKGVFGPFKSFTVSLGHSFPPPASMMKAWPESFMVFFFWCLRCSSRGRGCSGTRWETGRVSFCRCWRRWCSGECSARRWSWKRWQRCGTPVPRRWVDARVWGASTRSWHCSYEERQKKWRQKKIMFMFVLLFMFNNFVVFV